MQNEASFILPVDNNAPKQSLWPLWPWLFLAALAVVNICWFILTPTSVASNSLETIAIFCLLSAAAFLISKELTNHDLIYVLGMGFAFFLVAWPALRIFNHLTMTLALPWADASLSSWDRAIGFDWLAYITWLDGHPILLSFMKACYAGLSNYSAFFFILLAIPNDRRERCFEFVGLFISTASLCAVVGLFFPAQAAMAYYAPDITHLQYVTETAGTYHLEPLENLRQNPAPVLDLTDLKGLITFPSFHTAMGVVLIYSCRRHFLLLIPSVAINLIMIASTPLYGSHYVIDIIGGVVAALVSIKFVQIIRTIAKKSETGTAVNPNMTANPALA